MKNGAKNLEFFKLLDKPFFESLDKLVEELSKFSDYAKEIDSDLKNNDNTIKVLKHFLKNTEGFESVNISKNNFGDANLEAINFRKNDILSIRNKISNILKNKGSVDESSLNKLYKFADEVKSRIGLGTYRYKEDGGKIFLRANYDSITFVGKELDSIIEEDGLNDTMRILGSIDWEIKNTLGTFWFSTNKNCENFEIVDEYTFSSYEKMKKAIDAGEYQEKDRLDKLFQDRYKDAIAKLLSGRMSDEDWHKLVHVLIEKYQMKGGANVFEIKLKY